jgi:trimeric autotransporter adhesin
MQILISVRRYPEIVLVLLLSAVSSTAAEYHGHVTFNNYGVPGAIVTASLGNQKQTAITDSKGNYFFPDLPDGVWNIQIEMQAFSPIRQDVTVRTNMEPGEWEMKLLPLSQIQLIKAPSPIVAKETSAYKDTQSLNATGAARTREISKASNAETTISETISLQNSENLNQRAMDGFLINGTANNSASSLFSLSQAFGNNRRGMHSLYNGGIGFVIDNSALDARTYSLTGKDTLKPAYNQMQVMLSFGGPLRIPHVVRNGPNFFISYQGSRNRNTQIQAGLVPTLAERQGDLSQYPGQIFDPINGLPFKGNQIPANRISAQAQALLKLYPRPNFGGSTRYNYQIPIVGITHEDGVQVRIDKTLGRQNQFSGSFALQSMRGDNQTLLGFLDTSRSLISNLNANWRHNFTGRFFARFGYQFSRQNKQTAAFFQNRVNISGQAGIAGNNQESLNWGPPTLNFSSGLTTLSDAVPSSTRSETHLCSGTAWWSHGRNNITFGADYRRQQLSILSQQDPRGTFTFTGASTLGGTDRILLPGARNDFASFLLGIPDTASIAFGNADKYLRAASYDAYVTNDWRVNPNLTLNIGVRWEYWAPITELYGRLVNLDIAPGFSAVAPVVANDPVGILTGSTYPDSLLHPDKRAFQPRVGFAWRPVPASSMIVRGGYGIYYDTSPYQSIAMQMAQQSPLSKNLSQQSTRGNPLALADGFNAPPNVVTNTFAVDPNLRIGYSQTWQVSLQLDLPLSLQLTATYLGTKGTRALQKFLPNTYPLGAANLCLLCPRGFIYMTSNGNSTREAGTLEIRRRLHRGFTATVQYTFSKSIDNATVGGREQESVSVIAQDWLNLSAERALSSFDQRHMSNVQIMYTTGMVSGWSGVFLKGWTLASQINAGTGFPLTPVLPRAVSGTGVTGPLRPDYTGADIYAAPEGLYLNPDSYVAPAPGHWGNAGRNSITGPAQFTLNASLSRNFRITDRNNLDLRVEATNALNHVTFSSWNTTVGSAQFGLPMIANPMRNVRTTVRWRF